ncbi:MAG: aminotransferase [Elusimicrobia bacterium RIFOXYB2_FULL_50_12]|nr:MAG: aminotransferase [Elusimicrobia bacterium RIFOXYB2_FULL_50_12]
MDTKIRLSKSIVGEKEKQALCQAMDAGYLGMGTLVQQFEERLKNYIGARHAVTVNSGTAALHLALMALGLKPGDEVLIQSLTFVASLQAITAAGLTPVLCEVIPETCTIDLADAAKKLTPRTKAIMPVHYAGRPGDLEAVYAFAKRNNIRVVEDAAHAFGTVYKGKKIGSFGDIICFSFDGIKNITTGEGGAVVTNDDKVAQFVMDARLLGVQRDTEKRFSGQRSWEFDVTHQGYRYHMSNLFAAIGLVQLDRFEPEFKPARQSLAKAYHQQLSSMNGIILFPNDYDETVPHIFPIRVLNNKRDALRQHLLNQNIECGIHYYPNHLLTFYRDRAPFIITGKFYSELLSLPLHPDVTKDDQKRIITVIKEFFNNGSLS